MTDNYYQKQNERLKKKHTKYIKIFLKKKKKKSVSIIVNAINIFLKNKNRSYLSIE